MDRDSHFSKTKPDSPTPTKNSRIIHVQKQIGSRVRDVRRFPPPLNATIPARQSEIASDMIPMPIKNMKAAALWLPPERIAAATAINPSAITAMTSSIVLGFFIGSEL